MKLRLVLATLSIFFLAALTSFEASAARKVRLWCGGASASFLVTGNYSVCKNRATGEVYQITNLGIGLSFGLSAGIDYIEIKTSCRSIEGDLGGLGAQYVKGIGIKGEVYANRCMRALVVGGRAGFETGISLKGMSIRKMYRDSDYEERGRRQRYADRRDDSYEDDVREYRTRRSAPRYRESMDYSSFPQPGLQ